MPREFQGKIGLDIRDSVPDWDASLADGYSSHIPPDNGTIAHILRNASWSTFWVGKNHNVPIDAELGTSSPRTGPTRRSSSSATRSSRSRTSPGTCGSVPARTKRRTTRRRSTSAETRSLASTFSGGQIRNVVFDVADDVYVDVEQHLAAALARD
jgi:arylsulfatase A-like enzyme